MRELRLCRGSIGVAQLVLGQAHSVWVELAASRSSLKFLMELRNQGKSSYRYQMRRDR